MTVSGTEAEKHSLHSATRRFLYSCIYIYIHIALHSFKEQEPQTRKCFYLHQCNSEVRARGDEKSANNANLGG